MQIGLRHLLLALLASLGLHALAGIWLPAPEAGAQGPGEGGLLISLSASGGAAEREAREASAEEAAEEAEETQAEPEEDTAEERTLESEAEPAEVAPEAAAPEPEEAKAEPEAPAPAPQPAEMLARPAARPESLPAPPQAAPGQNAPAPRQTQEAALPPSPAEGAAEGSSAANAGSGGSSSAAGSAGGAPGAFDAYLAEIMAWLARHKTYPVMAERRRQEGTSEMVFTVARDGSLLAYELARSSGHALLDEASAEMLQRAAPLPPIPPEIGEESLTITAPIVFQLQ